MTDPAREWPGLDAILGARPSPASSLYAELLGLERHAEPGNRAAGTLANWPTTRDRRGYLAFGAIASLIDRVLLASVIRPPHQLASYTTVTLTVRQIEDVPPSGPLSARAQAGPYSEHFATSEGEVLDRDGRVVATASGVFTIVRSVPRAPTAPGATPTSATPSLTADASPADLHRSESRLRALEGPPDYLDVLGLHVAREEDSLTGTFQIGPEVWNAAAYLHGGALFGAAAECAVALLGEWRVVEQHCPYLLAAAHGQVTLRTRLLRAGRRVAVVAIEATTENGRLLAMILTTLSPVREA